MHRRSRGHRSILCQSSNAKERPLPRSHRRSSLRARMRCMPLIGLVIVGAWLYYTDQRGPGLYDATLQISRYTDLRGSVDGRDGGLQEASDSLEPVCRAPDRAPICRSTTPAAPT